MEVSHICGLQECTMPTFDSDNWAEQLYKKYTIVKNETYMYKSEYNHSSSVRNVFVLGLYSLFLGRTHRAGFGDPMNKHQLASGKSQ